MGVILNIKREFCLDINGLTIAGVAHGDPENPPLLALHGWLDNAASFDLLASHLSDRYLLAIDFIGHGKSSHRPEKTAYYIWENIADLQLVIDALCLERIDIVAHSMGAGIAMLFAASFPEKVGRLFLIDGIAPQRYLAEELPQLMAKAVRHKVRAVERKPKAYADLSTMIAARAKGRFPVSLDAAKLLVDRGSRCEAGDYYWSSDPALLLPSLLRMDTHQVTAFLQQVKAPVFVYLGDQGLMNETWEEYFKLVTDIQVSIFKGNHHLHMDSAGAKEISRAMLRIL